MGMPLDMQEGKRDEIAPSSAAPNTGPNPASQDTPNKAPTAPPADTTRILNPASSATNAAQTPPVSGPPLPEKPASDTGNGETPDASIKPAPVAPSPPGHSGQQPASSPPAQSKPSANAPWFMPKPKTTLFGRSIFIRLVLPIAFIFVMTMAGAAYLNFTKFEQTYTQLAHERYDDVVRDIKLSIEESLGIGLSLGATQSTQVVIDRTAAQYDGNFGLTILGPDGGVLFSTAGATVAELSNDETGKAVIDAVVERIGSGQVIGKSVTETHFLSTTDILSPLGEPEGVLVLEHSLAEVRNVIQSLGAILWRGVAILTAVFLVIIAVTVYLTIRPLERRFNMGFQSVESLLRTGDLRSDPLSNGRDDLDTGFAQARAIEREMLAAEAHIKANPVPTPAQQPQTGNQ